MHFRYLFLAALTGITSSASAQNSLQRALNNDTMPNLVPNPGFEEAKRLLCLWTQSARKFNEEVMVGCPGRVVHKPAGVHGNLPNDARPGQQIERVVDRRLRNTAASAAQGLEQLVCRNMAGAGQEQQAHLNPLGCGLDPVGTQRGFDVGFQDHERILAQVAKLDGHAGLCAGRIESGSLP